MLIGLMLTELILFLLSTFTEGQDHYHRLRPGYLLQVGFHRRCCCYYPVTTRAAPVRLPLMQARHLAVPVFARPARRHSLERRLVVNCS